jgi:hypothetical protein
MQDIQLASKIDEGAFGEVWKALYGDHLVALKKLKNSIKEMDDRAQEDFSKEIK